MKILSLLINEEVARAERNFERATSDNIVELCREYLRVLTEYRDQLRGLREIPEINCTEQSKLSRELITQSRAAVRATVEVTVTAHNYVDALLRTFTLIDAWDAAETFNRLLYKGSINWEVQGGQIRATDQADGEAMTIQEAVVIAGRLRREAYVANGITFFKSAVPALQK